MRRFLTPPLALLAGLALFLNGCSGESPTGPGGGAGGTGGGGTCNVSISLAATSVNPLAGTAVIIRATVKKGGAAVPDGTSVLFTTDFGFFLETGLNSVSKVTIGGFADVTLSSGDSGVSHVKANFECATTPLSIEFGAVPTEGPFITSISPAQGTCAGGDTVNIAGGRFGTNAATTRVSFGGLQATIVSVVDNLIVVKTPLRSLADPQVPETVDVVVTIGSRQAKPTVKFTYSCVNPNKRIFISSVVPNTGSPAGGDTVLVNGQNFGTNIATTRVTFGGVSASITIQTDSAITILTPRHALANPNVSETVDVGVTIDLGLVSQQSAVLANAFTYRGSGTGGGGNCNTLASLFISQVSPNTGSPDGGTTVTINGGGFGASTSTIRVEFGGKPAQVTTVAANSITAVTPQRNLANPDVPETVDVRVTVDVGGQNEACAILANAFTYTRLALVPVIFSVSPRTGPNDASTRVTIFGSGFQFPMQVFVTGGACAAQLVEATVVSIKSDQIVFLTPIAANGNVCLNNQLVTIQVTNPVTGKTASCMDCFKYYSCPVITTIEPPLGPYFGGTRVTISGHNFEEPVTITAGSTLPWQIVSVSSSSIVAITNGLFVTTCADVPVDVVVTGVTLSCPAATLTAGFLYQVASIGPVITGFSPPFLPQAGGVVTVTGANFFGNLRVIVNLKSGPFSVVPTVLSSTLLTFTAPAAANGDFNTQACMTGMLTGTQAVDTPVKFDVVNLETTCKATDSLTYQPTNTTCVTPPPTLTAAFAFVPGAAATHTVAFTDQSTTNGPLPITMWTWDFGDGFGAATRNTSHNYAAAGMFSVTLTVSDGTNSALVTKTVTAP